MTYREERQRFAGGAERLRWATQHHTDTRGRLLDFSERPYLVALYRDDSPERVIKKSVQVGITELLVLSALQYAYRGLNVFFAMPSVQLLPTFVSNRVDRVIHRSVYYQEQMAKRGGRASDSAGLKHFGGGAVKFIGANSPSASLEFPADVMILDERDAQPDEFVEDAEDRLTASPYKIRVEAGFPTRGGRGISARYEMSDQKRWFVKCPCCGRRQPLDFFEQVVRRIEGVGVGLANATFDLRDPSWPRIGRRDALVYCVDCGRPIDRLGPGEWVAEFPERELSGWHFNKLMLPTVTVGSLVMKFRRALHNPTLMATLMNQSLGLEYEAVEGARITEGMLAKCVPPAGHALSDTGSACTMGIDVGDPWKYVRISEIDSRGRRIARFIGRLKEWEEIPILIDRYSVESAVIDLRPEAGRVRALIERFPGVVWGCSYYTEYSLTGFRRNESEGLVTLNRTEALDALYQDIATHRIIVPSDFRQVDGGQYFRHLLAPQRREVVTKRGPVYVWEEDGRPDHYHQAESYDRVAGMLTGRLRQEDSSQPFQWKSSRAQKSVAPASVRSTHVALAGPMFRSGGYKSRIMGRDVKRRFAVR